jgi:hypothetical protein
VSFNEYVDDKNKITVRKFVIEEWLAVSSS